MLPAVECGGEVLHFIGKTVLAIFPLFDGSGSPHHHACADAINAAMKAERRLYPLNEERATDRLKPLGFGIGLHQGRVTYGNIGIPERLEFTVIGVAANEAVRIEGLTKELGENILISKSFSERCPNPLESKGSHKLRR